VALKIFAPVLLEEPEAMRRIEDEVGALVELQHPNIVGLKGLHRSGDSGLAIELEWIDGPNLAQWMKRAGQDLPFFEPRLLILAQVARGLAAAHGAGFLHRDLKPENVLLDSQGSARLTDFGLARSIHRETMTRLGLLVGSLAYMAPELINDQRPTPQSDLFSFGVMAYELLTGDLPFAGETPQALIQKISSGQFVSLRVRAPHLPVEICELVDQCLANDPRLRPASIFLVEAQLMTVLTALAKPQTVQGLLKSERKEDDLIRFYQVKHARLHTQIESFKSSEDPGDRRKMFVCLSELARLFPNDALLADGSLFAEKTSSKASDAFAGQPATASPAETENLVGPWRGWRRLTVAGFVAGLVALTWLGVLSWQSPATLHWQTPDDFLAESDLQPSKAPEAAEGAVPDVVEPTPEEPAAPEPKPVAAVATTPVSKPRLISKELPRALPKKKETKAAAASASAPPSPGPSVSEAQTPKVVEVSSPSNKPAEPVSTMGRVRFEVPEDVSVFVGERELGASEKNGLELPVGPYQIRLVKAGYMPIEHVIEVRADRESVVRAGGQP
jgi:serine/threonine protein kinase